MSGPVPPVESGSEGVADPPEGGQWSRRALLDRLVTGGAGALAAAVAGGGVLALLDASPAAAAPGGAAAAGSTPTKRKYRYGMVIDTKRCVGCKSCVAACKAENKTPPGVNYNVVLEEGQDDPNDKPVFFTKPCMHCEQPPCINVCPVSATFKRAQDGIVVVDYDRCIGCRYCIVACPYGSRTFDFGANYPAVAQSTAYAKDPAPEYGQFRARPAGVPVANPWGNSPVGNVRKCSFCLHLQDENGQYDKAAGRWPACAKTCTGHAIYFGDFNDPNSEVSLLLKERQAIRLKEELGTQPNVHYLL